MQNQEPANSQEQGNFALATLEQTPKKVATIESVTELLAKPNKSPAEINALAMIKGVLEKLHQSPEEESTALVLADNLLDVDKRHSYEASKLLIDDFFTTALRASHITPRGKYVFSDMSISKAFYKHFSKLFRYVFEGDSWYVYNGRFWIKDEKAASSGNVIRRAVDLLFDYATYIKHDEYTALTYYLQDYGIRNTLLRDAKSVEQTSIESFDNDKYLLNCENGTLNLSTMEFQLYDPNDLLT